MNESSYVASPGDGKEILRILESSAAKGQIELIYTRRPDAYESYMKENGQARVFLSKDNERPIGTCAEVIRRVYIGGQVRKVAYICGLKKDAEYEGGVGFGARFIRDLYCEDVDFYYCSVVAENEAARKMFEKSRRVLSMRPFIGYKTYILSPRVVIKAPKHSLAFKKATEKDLEGLLAFLNTEGAKRDLFPVIRNLEDFYNLKIDDFYLLLSKGEIVATAALWNQTEYKQYVVKKYRGIMRLARLANPLLSALRYIRLPKKEEALNFPMLSFLISRDDSEDYYRILLNEVKKEIGRRYGMFVLGLPKGHFASPILDRLPSVSFETQLYEVCFPRATHQSVTPDPKNSFLECGLL